MSNFTFENVILGSGKKSAIGLVSMDSANISNIHFRNITIAGGEIATPIFLKLGNRARGEDHKARKPWPPGSISDVTFTDITASDWGKGKASSGRQSSYTPTIEGVNSSFKIGPNIRFQNFKLVCPGGGESKDEEIDPPNRPDKYQPRYDGRRPSWGWFVRHAHDIQFINCSVEVASGKHDGRPAVVMDDVDGMHEHKRLHM